MMAGFGYSRDAIRVKVTKCEGMFQPEYRKFSVDPQITSFEVLQSILAKAFDIKGEFTVCYRTLDDYGQEAYLSLLSDWDLDAAFLSASEPCLCLQVDLKPFEESSEDWEADIARPPSAEIKFQNRLPGLILNQVERTFNMVQRALNLADGDSGCITNRSPLTDSEFRKFLDPIGQVMQVRELRNVIYLGGIEPSLRKVVWKHILNVYPEGMSGKERMDYMKRKSYEYQNLRDTWKNVVQARNGQVTGDLAYVTSMVRKDVLRTDRHHKFYGGSDDNQNIASLFNILTTYALNHPSVSYCQGMSDLASPLLVTMSDEAHAYICFCALMSRLKPNFLLDGITMTLKFQHLAEGLMFYDPDFYTYLKSHQADDLLFCYRWLLLEMKREFAFDDALRMLEVLWSSLPQMCPEDELPLFERKFTPQPVCDIKVPGSPITKQLRENPYTKVCALRRQSSTASLRSVANVAANKMSYRQNQSLDETSVCRNSKNKSKVKTFSSLDDASIHFLTTGSDLKHLTSTVSETLESSADETTVRNNQINKCDSHSVISKVAEFKGQLNKKFSSLQKRSQSSSYEKINVETVKEETEMEQSKKVVKNLNEFLNFSGMSKGNSLSNKLIYNISPKKSPPSSSHETFNNKELSDLKQPVKIMKPLVDEANLSNHSPTNSKKSREDSEDTTAECSSPDDSTEYFPMTTSMTRELRLELENLDRHVFGAKFNHHNITLEDSEELESPCSESLHSVEVKKCDCIVSKSDVPSEETTTEVAEICSDTLSKPANMMLHLGHSWNQINHNHDDKISQHNGEILDVCNESNDKKLNVTDVNYTQPLSPASVTGAVEEIFVWENPLRCPTTPDEQADLEFDGECGLNSSTAAGEIFENEGHGVKSVTPIKLVCSGAEDLNFTLSSSIETSSGENTSDISEGWGTKAPPVSFSESRIELLKAEHSSLQTLPTMTNSCEEVTERVGTSTSTMNSECLSSTMSSCTISSSTNKSTLTLHLPSPNEFGGGNPFLMFLCLTVLRQHRDFIMRNNMDYNEMAMHFDKMVRKHNVVRVLNEARNMFANYLQQQATLNNNVNFDLNV